MWTVKTIKRKIAKLISDLGENLEGITLDELHQRIDDIVAQYPNGKAGDRLAIKHGINADLNYLQDACILKSRIECRCDEPIKSTHRDKDGNWLYDD